MYQRTYCFYSTFVRACFKGDIGVCGIAVLVNFSCGISGILVLNCVIVVFSESAG